MPHVFLIGRRRHGSADVNPILLVIVSTRVQIYSDRQMKKVRATAETAETAAGGALRDEKKATPKK